MIFRWQLLLASIVLAGLVAGLLNDGLLDYSACLLVGSPLLLSITAYLKSR